jgi:two-component system, response regulator RegA
VDACIQDQSGGNGAQSPRLLVVDNDTNLREMLARGFARLGFEVATAPGLESATRQAREAPPDYAVIDLKLEDGSGLKLLPTLIAMNAAARVVILTGYGSIATAVQAIKLGAAQYLTKPAAVEDIIAAFHGNAGEAEAGPAANPMSLVRLEWEYIERMLHAHNGNVSATARALSMHRRTLQRKLAKRPVRS